MIIAGARAKIAGMTADVVNVSTTGALVRAAHMRLPGTECPLQLDVSATFVELTARVMRCEPVAGPVTSTTGQFALALTFVNTSADALACLERVCKTGQRADAEARRLHVTLERRCPRCQSHDVVKEGKRYYSCSQCGRTFTGFRAGFLRFAR